MSKPRLLDLFSGAGGAAYGYMVAGFHVTGVDNRPQPRYRGDAFIQADALEFLADPGLIARSFDAIHASPPCQLFTPLSKMWNAREHIDLITPTRPRLLATGLPYVMENVPGSPLRNPFTLCGSMFRLGIEGAELRRHRRFESNVIDPLMIPPCQHGWATRTIAVYGHAGGYSRRSRVIGVYGGHGRDRRRLSPQQFRTAQRAEAMGIDWMTGAELSQSIPPAYTRWIGEHLMQALAAQEMSA